jgi:hypothetical protein
MVLKYLRTFLLFAAWAGLPSPAPSVTANTWSERPLGAATFFFSQTPSSPSRFPSPSCLLRKAAPRSPSYSGTQRVFAHEVSVGRVQFLPGHRIAQRSLRHLAVRPNPTRHASSFATPPTGSVHAFRNCLTCSRRHLDHYSLHRTQLTLGARVHFQQQQHLSSVLITQSILSHCAPASYHLYQAGKGSFCEKP